MVVVAALRISTSPDGGENSKFSMRSTSTTCISIILVVENVRQKWMDQMKRERENVRKPPSKHPVWMLSYLGPCIPRVKKRSLPDAVTSTTAKSSSMEKNIKTNLPCQRNRERCLVHVCKNTNTSLLVGSRILKESLWSPYVCVFTPQRRQSVDGKIKTLILPQRKDMNVLPAYWMPQRTRE